MKSEPTCRGLVFLAKVWYNFNTSKSGRVSPLRLVGSPVPSGETEELDAWLTKPHKDENQVQQFIPSWRDTPRRLKRLWRDSKTSDVLEARFVEASIRQECPYLGTPVSPLKTLKGDS